MKEHKLRVIEEFRITNNRSVYNKVRLKTLLVGCPICSYNRGCNARKKKTYGFLSKRIRYPNWKLASKKRKQWMGKGYTVKIVGRYNKWIKFEI